ncbi:MAG TPA: MarR family transcriptional regulator [Pyrinomonadaceae bacterium]
MSRKPPIRKRAAAAGAFTDSLDVSQMTTGGMLFGVGAGHRIYAAIFRRLRALPKEGLLLVDLSRVRQASNQALKEALSVVDVLRTAKFEERFLVFRVDTRNRDLVDAVETVARLGRDVIPVIDKAGARHNFGKLTAAERDTLKAVERSGGLTSREMRERLGLLPSAASNRLRRLHHLRLIRREERAVSVSGGREFVYRPLVPPPAARRAARKAQRV